MPEIKLFDWDKVWVTTGPFIIAFLILILAIGVFSIFFGRMRRGLLKDVIGILAIVALAALTLGSIQVAAFIWGQ